jgi:DNA topoisomerase-1
MGIGKPSTMNSILEILETRQYISYDKQSILPTDLGKRLNDFLTQYFLKVIDYDFTARVEEEQEKVMLGQANYKDVISLFYKFLKEEIKQASLKIDGDKSTRETTAIVCPECKDNLLLKKINKKEGTFFYSCAGYQDKSCKATFSIGEDGQPTLNKPVATILAPCPAANCGGSITKRFNKKTQEVFYACTNWSEKSCKVTADANGNIKIPQPPKQHGKCSKCNKGQMVERTSKSGAVFLGCNRYPACRNAAKLQD